MGKTFSQVQDVNPFVWTVQSFKIKSVAFADRAHAGHLQFAILLNHQNIKETIDFYNHTCR